MSLDVEICNRALAACGARATIASLNEVSNEARACQRIYDSTRDELLSQAWWGFARAMEVGGLVKTATGGIWTNSQPSPPWKYQYAYPQDCIQLRYVTSQSTFGTPIPMFPVGLGFSPDFTYQPAGRFIIGSDVDLGSNTQTAVILTDIPSAILCYTRRITNQDLWPAQFEQAMVFSLAGYLAVPLTGNLALAKTMFQLAQEKCAEAQVSDGNEGLTMQDRIPESLRVRGIGDAFMMGIA